VGVSNEIVEHLENINGLRVEIVSKKINIPADRKPDYKKYAKA
jgi:hypothetical protein